MSISVKVVCIVFGLFFFSVLSSILFLEPDVLLSYSSDILDFAHSAAPFVLPLVGSSICIYLAIQIIRQFVD